MLVAVILHRDTEEKRGQDKDCDLLFFPGQDDLLHATKLFAERIGHVGAGRWREVKGVFWNAGAALV